MSCTIVKTSGSQCHVPSSKQVVHNVMYHRQNKWFTMSCTIVKTSGSQCHVPSSKPFRIQCIYTVKVNKCAEVHVKNL
jgi:hypothetical protein